MSYFYISNPYNGTDEQREERAQIAAKVDHIEKAQCTGPQGVQVLIERSIGVIKGTLKGKSFHNNGMRVVETISDYPEVGLTAIGGAIVGRLGIGTVTVTFETQRDLDLNSLEEAEMVFLDSEADLHRFPVRCQLF